MLLLHERGVDMLRDRPTVAVCKNGASNFSRREMTDEAEPLAAAPRLPPPSFHATLQVLQCGHPIFFENTIRLSCRVHRIRSRLRTMLSLQPSDDGMLLCARRGGWSGYESGNSART